ncbi:hypothetical protein SAMN02983003_1714 [Devosia enhydra]|uniref:EpsG family protein n=1 Tax=Devosia enhydra TaxID=665118 RepID=A0A1K2HXD1_9HYPH|nr:hypothetical protein [Devosia enhydra]SFZ83553.1 hypothetical protein SAMN02983003_1714 [Devosia enhydra]
MDRLRPFSRFAIPSEGVPRPFAIVVTLAAACLGIWLAFAYTTGDAIHYGALYTQLEGASLETIRVWQACLTSSTEPLFGPVYWLAAKSGLPRPWFIALANILLVGLLALWLWRHRAPWTTWLLVLSCYHLLVLLGSADRLKLAYIALLAGALVPALWQKGALLIAAAGLHFQSVMLIGAWIAGLVPRAVREPAVRARLPLLMALAAIAGLAVAAFLALNWSWALVKIEAYGRRSEGLVETIDLLALIAVGVLAGRDRWRALLTQLPLLVLSIPLGNSRLTIIGLSLLIVQLVEERRSGHPAFIALMAYMSWKSIGFVAAVAAMGNGFGTRLTEPVMVTLETCLQFFN